MKALLLIIFSTTLLQAQTFYKVDYATQRPQETGTISKEISTPKSRQPWGVCPLLLQDAPGSQDTCGEAVASEKPRMVQPRSSLSGAEETIASIGKTVDSAAKPLRVMRSELHQKRPTRTGPLSQNKAVAVVAAQPLQLGYRAISRFSGIVHQGGTVPTTLDTVTDAIAKAEGYYLKGSIPARFHNPGDLKAVRGQKYFGQVRVGKGGHIVFRNDAAGWYALRTQVQKMIDGRSKHYRPSMSIQQIAKKYAGNYRVWAKNVSKNLGVQPTCTLAELFDIPPTLEEIWQK